MSATTINFMINDKEVTVPKGTSVMRAAKQEGIEIPHFCWHPKLKTAGVCRFCMVKVEGRPKLEIACNLEAVEGMEVSTLDPEVKEAHKWALEFHLVNHPLDCPICDQAGECKLQDSYMEVGQYKSQMNLQKVLKPKDLKVGEQLVLDTERCILCTRCVRFEDDVTKTGNLGIFNRGDRAVIGTFPDKQIEHNYQENLVDICPVGAFTSSKFRFKQRVWFLEEKNSTCPGCSTNCKISIHAKPRTNTYYRVKPQEDQVGPLNWLCDNGRTVYSHLNPDKRMRYAMHKEAGKIIKCSFINAINSIAQAINSTDADKVGLLIPASYTNEENDKIVDYFATKVNTKHIYQWRNDKEQIANFDDILKRGDHFANTKGLTKALTKHKLGKEIKNEFDKLAGAKLNTLICITPELAESIPNYIDKIKMLAELGLEHLSVWSVTRTEIESFDFIDSILPLKGFTEKNGTFINYNNEESKLQQAFPCYIEEAKDIVETIDLLQVNSK